MSSGRVCFCSKWLKQPQQMDFQMNPDPGLISDFLRTTATIRVKSID